MARSVRHWRGFLRVINGWGEQNCFHSPLWLKLSCICGHGLRGQLCSALGTTAGQNLAAVGGSHSLSEAMHLGSVTLSGLIGTNSCHEIYTSCKNMLNSCEITAAARLFEMPGISRGTYDGYYTG